MQVLGHHIMLRLPDGRPIALTRTQGLLVMRLVFRKARPYGLILVRLADTHLHLVCACDRAEAGKLGRALAQGLKRRLALPVAFEPIHAVPIESGRHMSRLPRYLFEQRDHHGFTGLPNVELSNLPDLLGLRLTGRYTIPLFRSHLRRLQASQLCAWLGCQSVHPADGPVEWIPQAAARAVGREALVGRKPDIVQARIAALDLALNQCQLPPEQAALLFGISRRTLRRLSTRPADPLLAHAIGLQLGFLATQSPGNEDEQAFLAPSQHPKPSPPLGAK